MLVSAGQDIRSGVQGGGGDGPAIPKLQGGGAGGLQDGGGLLHSAARQAFPGEEMNGL